LNILLYGGGGSVKFLGR